MEWKNLRPTQAELAAQAWDIQTPIAFVRTPPQFNGITITYSADGRRPVVTLSFRDDVPDDLKQMVTADAAALVNSIQLHGRPRS